MKTRSLHTSDDSAVSLGSKKKDVHSVDQKEKRDRFNKNLSMEDFLDLCHIPLDDTQTRSVLATHAVHHWSVFINLPIEALQRLGFLYGPASLIYQGTLEAAHHSKRAKKTHKKAKHSHLAA